MRGTLCVGKKKSRSACVLIIFLPACFMIPANLFIKSTVANFSQLCGRLVVFVVFWGEFWSVKFVETRGLYQTLFCWKQRARTQDRQIEITLETKREPSKPNIETKTNEVSNWTVYNSFHCNCHRRDRCYGQYPPKLPLNGPKDKSNPHNINLTPNTLFHGLPCDMF